MAKATALITGASRGIGRGIALALAGHGYNIAAVATRLQGDADRPGLADLQLEVKALGVACLPIVADVSDLMSHEQVVVDVVDQGRASGVMISGKANKNQMGLQMKLQRMAERLAAAMATSVPKDAGT